MSASCLSGVGAAVGAVVGPDMDWNVFWSLLMSIDGVGWVEVVETID